MPIPAFPLPGGGRREQMKLRFIGLRSFPVFDYQFRVGDAVEFVGDQAVRGAYAVRQRLGRVELDGVEREPAARKFELQVLVLDQALGLDFELVEKTRLGKALAPGRYFQQARGLQVEVAGLDRAVGFYYLGQRRSCDEFARHLLEAVAKTREVGLEQTETCGGGVAAEFEYQTRFALGHQIEGVAQIQAGD